MIKYSVIVPFYNTQDYVMNILTWFYAVSNNRNDIELILVDDGSTIEINKNSIKSDNVKLYKKSNGGVSSARNYGLTNANGDYVLFLDSDDSYSELIFLTLDEHIEKGSDNLDLIVFSYEKIFNGKSIKVVNENMQYSSSLLQCFFSKALKPHICSILFKRSLLMNNALRFTEGISHSEDLSFIARSFAVSRSSKSIADILFKYCYRNGSAINSLVNQKSLSHFISFDEILSIKTTIDIDFHKNFYVSTCYLNFIKFAIIQGVSSLSVCDVIYSKSNYLNLSFVKDFKFFSIKQTYLVLGAKVIFLLPFNPLYWFLRTRINKVEK